MFHLLKFIVWIAGILVLIYLALPFFGYEVNTKYFDKSADRCQEKINECSKNILENGTKNAKCDLICVNPGLIIKKK
jgi:hypothetical protein